MNAQLPTVRDGALVKRSTVAAQLLYGDYRQELRVDFFYSCSYCQISECEAQTISFEIDHYIPKHAAPFLISNYTNLMYSCDICNGRKSNLNPPPNAVAAGIRFFKIDADVFADHFEFSRFATSQTDRKYEIFGKTGIGEWTIDALDLNRDILLRLRKLRHDLYETDAFTQGGILSLREFPIDRLPVLFRARAQAAIENIDHAVRDVSDDIDDMLRSNARSAFADPEPDNLRKAAERKSKTAAYMVQFPGAWRAEKKPRASSGTKPKKPVKKK